MCKDAVNKHAKNTTMRQDYPDMVAYIGPSGSSLSAIVSQLAAQMTPARPVIGISATATSLSDKVYKSTTSLQNDSFACTCPLRLAQHGSGGSCTFERGASLFASLEVTYPYFYRMALPDDVVSQAILAFAKYLNVDSVGCIFADAAYPLSIANAIDEKAPEMGVVQRS
eukprot:3287678-Amphidinium_carterae.1